MNKHSALHFLRFDHQPNFGAIDEIIYIGKVKPFSFYLFIFLQEARDVSVFLLYLFT